MVAIDQSKLGGVELIHMNSFRSTSMYGLSVSLEMPYQTKQEDVKHQFALVLILPLEEYV